MTAAAKQTFGHPGFDEALRKGLLDDLFGMVGYLPEETVVQLKDDIIGMGSVFKEDEIGIGTALAGAEYTVALHKFHDHIDAETREAIRQSVVAQLNRLKGESEDPRLTQQVQSQLTMLESNFGKGLLIGNPAPELYFTWSSDETLKTLEDLKGKVVVLDFWATWCGPCIASFPNVAELKAHYDGYDVAIIGVTSIQGRHYPGDGPPVDCTGDPEKEIGLMPAFMEAKDMTWTVAFSQQEVFNPEYGVRGIPHVAILDAEGNVRYNGLHPASPLEEKTAKIDKLLKEAGLETPGDGG